MKLVIGGAYQGKRAYVEEHDSIQKWANGEICPEEEIFSCEGMVDFHLYLRRLLQEGKEQYVREQLIPKLLQENPGLPGVLPTAKRKRAKYTNI